jgi:hypothetical protein
VYKALLKKSGVQLISITEPVEDTAVGRLMQAIIECIDVTFHVIDPGGFQTY